MKKGGRRDNQEVGGKGRGKRKRDAVYLLSMGNALVLSLAWVGAEQVRCVPGP